jgi:hypothetical protein
MVQFTTTIHQFEEKGEKTGWTYIEVPADLAEKLKPNNKKSFRVKGKLDDYPIIRVALIPMGGGSFIMAINAAMRKGMGKRKGAMLKVHLEPDESKFKIDKELLDCLADEPKALARFQKMPPSHQHYYSKWIAEAKTAPTKAKRIAMTVTSMVKGLDFGEMLRAARRERDGLD